jgi:hypothetical protein
MEPSSWSGEGCCSEVHLPFFMVGESKVWVRSILMGILSMSVEVQCDFGVVVES